MGRYIGVTSAARAGDPGAGDGAGVRDRPAGSGRRDPRVDGRQRRHERRHAWSSACARSTGSTSRSWSSSSYWLAHFVTGDWGTSIGTGEKVFDMFVRRLPVTLELFVGATIWSIAIGIPAGIIGALKRNSATDVARDDRHHDRRLDPGVLGGDRADLPARRASSRSCRRRATCRSSRTRRSTSSRMLLPTFVLGTHSAGLLARYVRSSLLEVLGQDYIRTARAKGFSEARGRRPARAEAGDDSRRHRHRPRLGAHAGRRLLRRGDLRHPRPRPDERRCDLPEGFPGDAGDPDRGLAQRAAGQPAGRHPLRLSRSARSGCGDDRSRTPATVIATGEHRESAALALLRAVTAPSAGRCRPGHHRAVLPDGCSSRR